MTNLKTKENKVMIKYAALEIKDKSEEVLIEKAEKIKSLKGFPLRWITLTYNSDKSPKLEVMTTINAEDEQDYKCKAKRLCEILEDFDLKADYNNDPYGWIALPWSINSYTGKVNRIL